MSFTVFQIQCIFLLIFILFRTIISQNNSSVPFDINDYLQQDICDDSVSNLAKHVVLIRRLDSDLKHHMCIGVIIKYDAILTAAHCVTVDGMPIDVGVFYVVAGTENRLQSASHTQVERVRKVIIHKLFNYIEQIYDIAIMKLKNSFKKDEGFVEVPDYGIYKPIPGDNCIVLGWGKIYSDGPIVSECWNVTIHDTKSCKKYIKDEDDETRLCASDKNRRGIAFRGGDIGSPLFCHNTLTGFMSYYTDYMGNPKIYTNVYEYKDWILAKSIGWKLHKTFQLIIILNCVSFLNEMAIFIYI